MKKHYLSLVLAVVLLSCGVTERDYRVVHRNALVADMHSDTVLRVKKGFDLAERAGHPATPYRLYPILRRNSIRSFLFSSVSTPIGVSPSMTPMTPRPCCVSATIT